MKMNTFWGLQIKYIKNKYISELQKKKYFTKFNRGAPDANANNKGYAYCALQMFLCLLTDQQKRNRFPRLRGWHVKTCGDEKAPNQEAGLSGMEY